MKEERRAGGERATFDVDEKVHVVGRINNERNQKYFDPKCNMEWYLVTAGANQDPGNVGQNPKIGKRLL